MKETISPDYAEDHIRRHHSRHSLFEETVNEVNQEISRERLRETELPALVVKRPRLPLPSERARAAAILKSSDQLYLPPVGRRTFPTKRGILPKIDTGLHKNNAHPPKHDSFGIDKNVSRQNQDQRNDLPRIAPGLGKLKIPLNQLKTGSSKTETYLEKYQRKKLNAQSKTDSGLDKQTAPQVKRESKINGELRVKRAVCGPVKLPVHSKTDSGLKRVPRPPPALLPKLESGSKNPAPYLPKRPTVPKTDSYLKTRNSGHRQVKSKIDTGLGRTKPTYKGNGSKEEACTDLRKTQELDRENTKSAGGYTTLPWYLN
ncbi:hypothetical protein SNE40_015123 [Patella caerulea]|uniref:Uncharacterized protein n=1 Tax=Patella caerulea TaxID=87958 RepID=A0AAN8JMK5_PATCE